MSYNNYEQNQYTQSFGYNPQVAYNSFDPSFSQPNQYQPQQQYTPTNLYIPETIPQQHGYASQQPTNLQIAPAPLTSPSQMYHDADIQGNMTYHTTGSNNESTGSGGKFTSGFSSENDDIPILEELGIDFNLIMTRTREVLNPITHSVNTHAEDCELAGPLVFCLLFGSILLVSGKIQFGYIYGVSILGCIGIYCLLWGMANRTPTFWTVVSVLGYCMLPMVLLAAFGLLFTLNGSFGLILTGVVVLWCAVASSNIFTHSLEMIDQKLLVAYPCALIYGVFALLTVF